MNKIYILRGGAPDKFEYQGSGDFKYLKLDHTNLTDLTEDQINGIIEEGDYIVSGFEGDVAYANTFNSDHIILPDVNPELIKKNSIIYQELVKGIKYWVYPMFKNVKSFDECRYPVIKCSTGSGSREVLVECPDLADLIGKPFMNKITEKDFNNLLRKSVDDQLINQELIPMMLNKTKATANLVFKDGKLLGYVWTEVLDKTKMTTNWDRGFHVVNEFTEDAVQHLAEFLLKYISRGIVNLDFHIDQVNKLCWLTEFNWRIGNNFFESNAGGVCLFDKYIKGEEFSMPEGANEFVRYWKCMYVYDNPFQITPEML